MVRLLESFPYLDGKHVLVLEKMDCDLRHFLQTEWQPNSAETERQRVVRDIADALHDLKLRSIVHRDVEPQKHTEKRGSMVLG